MTTNMNSSSQFKDLNEFLAKHSAKNEQKVGESLSFTHTRIGDKELNIYAFYAFFSLFFFFYDPPYYYLFAY